MTIRELVGQNIRKYRKTQKFSQEELAYRSNISIGSLGKLERGVGNPTLEILTKIAEALSIEPRLLFLEDITGSEKASSRLKKYESKLAECSTERQRVIIKIMDELFQL